MPLTVVDAASAAVRNLIVRGHYQPGDRLPPERELAEALGLSRPTLREALRRLTEAGLLQPRRGSGTYVAAVDLDGVFAVRLQLEPFAAGLAAEHREPVLSDRLRALAAELRRTIDEPEAFAAADLELHRTIAAATCNVVLIDILERLTEITQLSRSITSPEPAARRATLRDLRALVKAVRAGDARAATDAMRRHLESVRAVALARPVPDRRLERLSAPPPPTAHPAVEGTGKARR